MLQSQNHSQSIWRATFLCHIIDILIREGFRSFTLSILIGRHNAPRKMSAPTSTVAATVMGKAACKACYIRAINTKGHSFTWMFYKHYITTKQDTT